MTWQKWVFAVAVLVSWVLRINKIDEPREKLTKEVVSGSIVLDALLVWLVLSI